MELREHSKYFLGIGDDDLVLESYEDLVEKLQSQIISEEGVVSLAADDGQRPWWQRFIFGAKIYVRSYLTFEWKNGTCGLIFHDENTSEYRALSKFEPKDVSESTRKKISFGEYEPLDKKYCIEKELAVKAINEYLDSGIMPTWLEYDFTK